MVTTARQELQSVGVMSVGWMAFVGVVITIEQRDGQGRALSRPGVALRERAG